MANNTPTEPTDAPAASFIRTIVEDDVQAGRYPKGVITRFPPEPNGYLHIGHAKAIVLNFGIARDYDGVCNLRFDDTNPTTEDVEYVESIKRDVEWLGFTWDDRLYYASDYFEQLYQYAEELVRKGLAYVDSQTEDEIRSNRGSVTEPGTPSPYRERSPEENLDLFRRMRAGEFSDGAHVLRARGNMASPNMKMRDPLLYRIRHAHHYRTGDDWCIYPMYDFAHPLSDAIEDISHSLCTLEFENNREIYDWVLDNLLPEPRPHQYEFARFELDYTVLSKRKLLVLVKDGHVAGWDDPRMPTLAGLRRRGVTPQAICALMERVGVARANSRTDIGMFEHATRDDLNFRAPRVMCVARPLKVVLTDFPADRIDWLDASYWPHDVPKEGSRKVPFTRELYIEHDDFMEDPPRRYHRLAPGREVRLRYGYIIRCDEVVHDADGNVVELRCSHDAESRGGTAPDGRKVRGTIHWVSATESVPCELRLYDRLFTIADPEEGDAAFTEHLNPESLVRLPQARIEPSVKDDPADTRYQFERLGYFWQDPVDSRADSLVFNRIISLRDTWGKIRDGDGDGARDEAPSMDVDHTRAATGGESGMPAAPVDPLERLTDAEREHAERYGQAYGLAVPEAAILAGTEGLGSFFEKATKAGGAPKSVANWLVNELLRDLKEQPLDTLPFGPAEIAELVSLVDDGTINSRIAREVYAEMLRGGGSPRAIVTERGLAQVSDIGALEPAVDRVVAANPEKVDAYRSGKTGLIGFFVGQVMRDTQGKANPEMVRQLLEERLG